MTQLEINLLGTFQAKLDGEVVTGFRSDKTRALLAYLLVEGTRTHRRDWLATLLWGEFDDRSARRSLSSALANLRHLLAPMGPPRRWKQTAPTCGSRSTRRRWWWTSSCFASCWPPPKPTPIAR
jgi:DNA-binding SARP family transcriptional activator